MLSMGKSKTFKPGDTAYVVDAADYVANNEVHRIPLGTPVKIRTASTLSSLRFEEEVRYEVSFEGGPVVCWVDADRLTSKIIDVNDNCVIECAA